MKTEHNRRIGRRPESGPRRTVGPGAKTKPVSPPEPLDSGKAIVIKPMTKLERT